MQHTSNLAKTIRRPIWHLREVVRRPMDKDTVKIVVKARKKPWLSIRIKVLICMCLSTSSMGQTQML